MGRRERHGCGMNALMAPVSTRDLWSWLDENAPSLDTQHTLSVDILPQLAAGGVLGVGVAEALGGSGGDVTDAVEAIAQVSEYSLAAGLVFWGHRSYIEFLVQSPNTGLRDRQLPELMGGRTAGASGLSNAMKFLSGLEDLQVSARPQPGGFALDGKLPWVTNLRPQGFHVATAVACEGYGTFVASLSHDDIGLVRSTDLDLMAMRATNTAAVSVADVRISKDRIIHPDANSWFPAMRPAFLGLQYGMSIGLARRALKEARRCVGAGRHVLSEPIRELAATLANQEQWLRAGLRSGIFRDKPAELFHIRIALADIVARAVGLELQGTGGRAYMTAAGGGFSRRWREAAFVPVITPSLVQIKTALTSLGSTTS